jgi:GT2 family glycosyltransferase
MKKFKIGVIYCAYGTEKYIEPSLRPWLNRKKHHDILIAGVHGMFKEYKDMGFVDHDVETLSLLKKADLDYLYIQNDYNNPEGSAYYEQEHEVRNNGLKYLLANECDYIILLDSDEIWTELEIENMIEYVQKNPFIAWFGVEFKNLTFSEKTYTKGFCPPRIFKTSLNGKKLTSLYWDNDFDYEGKSYKEFSNKRIPTHLANPLHFTWLNDQRSFNKIEYQTQHFQNGFGCSFAWDQEKGLIWNEAFFQRTRQPKPNLYTI